MLCAYTLHVRMVYAYTLLQIRRFNLTCFRVYMLRNLQAKVTPQNDALMQYLPHINALLERAVTLCKAAETSTPVAIQTLKKQDNIPPGKTNDLQWRFKKTAKSPGRKRTGLVLRYAN